MSRFFVDDPPFPIKEFEEGTVLDEEGEPKKPNIVWIKPRMDVATQAKVQNATLILGKDNQPEFRIGDHGVALLVYNIVRWEGPDFDKWPCTPEWIRKLYRSEPFIERVYEEIASRNQVAVSPNRPSLAIGTSMNDGEGGSSLTMQAAIPVRSGNGILRSRLQQHLDGLQTRSDD